MFDVCARSVRVVVESESDSLVLHYCASVSNVVVPVRMVVVGNIHLTSTEACCERDKDLQRIG